ncbi:MAG: hypothetical protein KF774_04905 [Planctomyces sp.]|nr:hypothetical protein [Planctomyces sp.]
MRTALDQLRQERQGIEDRLEALLTALELVELIHLRVLVLDVQHELIEERHLDFLSLGSTGSGEPKVRAGAPPCLRPSEVQSLLDSPGVRVLADVSLATTNGSPAIVHSGGTYPVKAGLQYGYSPEEAKTMTVGSRVEAVARLLSPDRLLLQIAIQRSEIDAASEATADVEAGPALTQQRINTLVELSFDETIALGGLVSVQGNEKRHRVFLVGASRGNGP